MSDMNDLSNITTYPLTPTEKVAILGFLSSFIEGSEEAYNESLKTFLDLQEDRTMSIFIQGCIVGFQRLIDLGKITTVDPAIAGPFYLECYSKLPLNVRDLDEEELITWFPLAHFLRLEGELHEIAIEILGIDPSVSMMRLALAWVAISLGIDSIDPISVIREQMEEMVLTIPLSDDAVMIPGVYTKNTIPPVDF